jgi:hypothetical protein
MNHAEIVEVDQEEEDIGGGLVADEGMLLRWLLGGLFDSLTMGEEKTER